MQEVSRRSGGRTMSIDAKKNALGGLLEALASSFKEERQKEEPYKEMFRAGSTFTDIFREMDHQMTTHVLDGCDVISERLGMRVNKAQYRTLLALPLLVQVAEEDAKRHEGSACCIDKAFYILSEQFKALGAEGLSAAEKQDVEALAEAQLPRNRLSATRWTDPVTGSYINLMSRSDEGICVYAVRNEEGSCLNKDGEWEHEPLPSNRDDDFLSRCRFHCFESAADALDRAS